jgi:cell volume regulation protein A
MLTRGNDIIPPRGSTLLKAGDHLFVMQRPQSKQYVERAFSRLSDTVEFLPSGKLRLKGSTTIRDIFDSYDIHLDAPEELTLEKLVMERLPEGVIPAVNEQIQLNGLAIGIVEMVGKRIATICLSPAIAVSAKDAAKAAASLG